MISEATRRNWERLGTRSGERLRQRANKSASQRRIVPTESISGRGTRAFLKALLPLCEEGDFSRQEVLYAVAEAQLKQAGILSRPDVQKLLRDSGFAPSERLPLPPLPSGERDVPGITYQFLLREGEKNRLGSYYTPAEVVRQMLPLRKLRSGERFFDPCCGSGSFLLAFPSADPERLWGCDRDPVAVFLARVNLLCRFPDRVFSPHVYECDYLSAPAGPLKEQKFDWIATNPPWGAEEAAGNENFPFPESFARFFFRAWEQLCPNGEIAFLFPEAALSVKKHAEFRKFLTGQCRIEEIRLFPRLFSGVMTKYFSLRAKKAEPQKFFILRDARSTARKIPLSGTLRTPDRRFRFLSPAEERLLEKIDAKKNSDLRGSTFALGIVTGDNKRLVFPESGPGREPVFAGQDISRYTLVPPRNYLRFQPEQFQQTAPEACYRAPEKLLYRFIADRPVFALDTGRSLCLNSANVLIPRIPGMGIRTVLALLNSALFRWYYRTAFGGVKVLKGHLQALPFPAITPEEDRELTLLVERVLSGDPDADAEIQNRIFEIFAMTPTEISLMNKNR